MVVNSIKLNLSGIYGVFLKMVTMGEHNFKNAIVLADIVVLEPASIKRNLANLRKNFDTFFEYT